MNRMRIKAHYQLLRICYDGENTYKIALMNPVKQECITRYVGEGGQKTISK